MINKKMIKIEICGKVAEIQNVKIEERRDIVEYQCIANDSVNSCTTGRSTTFKAELPLDTKKFNKLGDKIIKKFNSNKLITVKLLIDDSDNTEAHMTGYVTEVETHFGFIHTLRLTLECTQEPKIFTPVNWDNVYAKV